MPISKENDARTLRLEFFTVGAQRGSLAEIAAITALAPTITAVVSTVFDDHVMRWWQVLGAIICAAGVAVIGVA